MKLWIDYVPNSRQNFEIWFFVLLSMSFMNSCITNFLLILGKLNVLPICNKFETSGGILVLERFLNHFSLVCSSGFISFWEKGKGDNRTFIRDSLVDVWGLVSLNFRYLLELSLMIQWKLIGLISLIFFWIVWCDNQSNFFLCMKNICVLNLLNRFQWCL